MINKLLIAYFILLINFYTNAQTPKPSTGTIERLADFKSKFVDTRNIDVWLPDGYSTKTKYAVLYMHDGQMLFDSTNTWNKQEWGVDETIGKLIKEDKIKPCIVVGIANGGKMRHPEYFPQKPFNAMTQAQKDTLYKSLRGNGQTVFGNMIKSDNYLKFIVQELKPFIDKKYNTAKDAKNTFIAGSSMGGLISMYAICEYPKVFGGAACMSTHWIGIFDTKNNSIPDAFMTYLTNTLPNPKKHKLYFDYGTATLDALYLPYQKRADVILKQKGFTDNNWLTKMFEGDDHSEKSWRKRLDIPLLFLLKK